MPITYEWIVNTPQPFINCPHCATTPFTRCMPGMVERKSWSGKKTYAIICSSCHTIVGYERARKPDDNPLRQAVKDALTPIIFFA